MGRDGDRAVRARRWLWISGLSTAALVASSVVAVESELPRQHRVMDPLDEMPLASALLLAAAAATVVGHFLWAVSRVRSGLSNWISDALRLVLLFLAWGFCVAMILPLISPGDPSESPTALLGLAYLLLMLCVLIPVSVIWACTAVWRVSARERKLRATELRDDALADQLHQQRTDKHSSEQAEDRDRPEAQSPPPDSPNPVVAEQPGVSLVYRIAFPGLVLGAVAFSVGLGLEILWLLILGLIVTVLSFVLVVRAGFIMRAKLRRQAQDRDEGAGTREGSGD